MLTDTGHHQWTLHVHHIAFGSIIDVYTAPATGTEPGTAVSSELTVKRGDEGHAITVRAYSHGALGPTAERNGNFGVAQTTLDVPARHGVITVFGDGRQNAPLTLVSLSSAQRAPFTDDQSATLRKLRRRGGEIWRAYSLKEAFRAIVTGDLDPDDVEALIDRWISRASRSRLTPFLKAAKTIRRHRDGILTAIHLNINNGRTEGLNNFVDHPPRLRLPLRPRRTRPGHAQLRAHRAPPTPRKTLLCVGVATRGCRRLPRVSQMTPPTQWATSASRWR